MIPSQGALAESSLFQLWHKYRRCASGIISSCCGERAKSVNSSNDGELKAILLGAGYSVTAIGGMYKEEYKTPDERDVAKTSFIVFDQYGKGTLKRDLVKLGEKYNQDFITYSETPEIDATRKIVQPGGYYLIGTSKRPNSYPGYHKEILLAKPLFGKDGEIHFRINGCPFTFHELVYEPGDLLYDDVSRKHGVYLRGLMARMYRKACADSEDEIIPYD